MLLHIKILEWTILDSMQCVLTGFCHSLRHSARKKTLKLQQSPRVFELHLRSCLQLIHCFLKQRYFIVHRIC